MLHIAAAVLVALLLAPAATAATTTPTAPVYDSKGRLVQTPYAPPNSARLTKKKASDIFLHNHEVAHWLKHYPRVVTYDATYSPKNRNWTVHVWSGKAGEVAQGTVDDATGEVTEALTGPQVAWGMARGGPGAFGGEKINSKPIWLAFCAVFLLGLGDLRRLLSLRNLDLLVLLSFTFSLWYFNRGDIFTSVPLAYPPLVYLLGRTVWIGIHGRGTPTRPFWPVWVLVAATVFLAGFKVGMNIESSNVIDVGYAGPIGAERIVHEHQAPYDHFPVEDNLKPCGLPDANGEIRNRIQTNGRCESANPQADTYGPVSYESYIPAYLVFGWSGKWDSLPAAHATAILFDLLCILGLGLVGLRFGGVRLGVGFVVAPLAAFSILLLEPHPIHAVGTFWRHTFSSQIHRHSPFSLWDWKQYRAKGIPDLHWVQHVLEVLLVLGTLAATFFPRRKSPLQLAALTCALLIGFEIVLTHWFYLYIPWFFPFAAFALLAPARAAAPRT